MVWAERRAMLAVDRAVSNGWVAASVLSEKGETLVVAAWLLMGAFQFWGKLAVVHEIGCLAFASGSVPDQPTSSLRAS